MAAGLDAETARAPGKGPARTAGLAGPTATADAAHQQQMMEMMAAMIAKLTTTSGAPPPVVDTAQPPTSSQEGPDEAHTSPKRVVEARSSLSPPILEPVYQPAGRLDALYR